MALWLCGLGVLALALVGAWVLWSDGLPFSSDPARCMCHASLILPADPAKRAALISYFESQEFILTILRRDLKYAELIPEVKYFWRPTITDFEIRNNNVETNFDRSYQGLFYDLRRDIYAELEYREAIALLDSEEGGDLRMAFSMLDAAKAQNPLVDLEAPLQQAVESAPSDQARAILTAALDAARKGEDLERAYNEVVANSEK